MYQAFNHKELMENFSGDEDILKDLILEFIKRYSDILAQIDNSIKNKNFSELKLHAHTYKGVVSNFYAEKVRLIAFELEKKGANSDPSDLLTLFNQIVDESKKLINELESLEKSL